MKRNLLKEALELTGSQHRYQKMMIGLLIIAWISMMFVFLSSILMFIDPLFYCTKTGDYLVKQKDACQIIFQKTDQCHVSTFKYYKVNNFTVTSYSKLYCQKEWARIFIQCAFPIGSFIGLMIMNLISDIQGRKRAFIFSIKITLIGILRKFLPIQVLIVGAYFQNVYILVISQFMRGFGTECVMPLCYTLCADFLSDGLRPKAIVILNSSGQLKFYFRGLVSIILGIFYMIKLNWLTFTIVFQFIPFFIILIFFCFYLQQSPYILMDMKKQVQARQVFHQIAKFNGRQDKILEIDDLIEKQIKQRKIALKQQTFEKASMINIYNTIKNKQYLKPIIILIILNGIANINYFGVAYCFSYVGMGYGYNSMIFGVVQFGSILFVSKHILTIEWIATNVPRRKGISGFYAVTTCIGLLYFLPFIKNNLIISTFLIGFSRIFSVSGNNLIGCMETEAFATEIQSSAIGLAQGLGLWGAVMAPFLVSIAQNFDIHPMALIALFVSTAIWLPYFLKQTFTLRVDRVKQCQNNQIQLLQYLTKDSSQIAINSKQKIIL